MAKNSKNYKQAKEKIEDREYPYLEAISLLKEIKSSKFDESVDISMRLGVDPKYADQLVRGTVVLPHGTGKTKRVLVIANGEKQKEAQEAGADFFGGEELVEKIQKENWFEFDVIVAAPNMMRHVGKLGRVLGPKGLMPNPKSGTVTPNVGAAVKDIKAGKVEYRVDKTSIIHVSIGKASFGVEKLGENLNTLMDAVLRARPSSAKGTYMRSAVVSSTMGPGIKMNPSSFSKSE